MQRSMELNSTVFMAPDREPCLIASLMARHARLKNELGNHENNGCANPNLYLRAHCMMGSR